MNGLTPQQIEVLNKLTPERTQQLIALIGRVQKLENQGFDISDYLLDEDTMVSNSNKKGVTQQSIKAYADTKIPTANLLDEDDMASDSATKPASQQSIKAYADAMLPSNACVIETGKYNGDNTNNRTITLDDSNLVVKHIHWMRSDGDGQPVVEYWTNDVLMDSDGEGMVVRRLSAGTGYTYDNFCDTVGTGSFRVDSSMNATGKTYYYTVFGTH